MWLGFHHVPKKKFSPIISLPHLNFEIGEKTKNPLIFKIGDQKNGEQKNSLYF